MFHILFLVLDINYLKGPIIQFNWIWGPAPPWATDSNHSQLEADGPDSNGCYLLVPGDTVCVVSYTWHMNIWNVHNTHTLSCPSSFCRWCVSVSVYTQSDGGRGGGWGMQIYVKWIILLVPCVFSLELTASRDGREKRDSVQETLLQMNRKRSEKQEGHMREDSLLKRHIHFQSGSRDVGFLNNFLLAHMQTLSETGLKLT